MFEFVYRLRHQDVQASLAAFIHTARKALLAQSIRELLRIEVICVIEVHQRNDAPEYVPSGAKICAKIFASKLRAKARKQRILRVRRTYKS